MRILAADVGGTKTLVSLFERSGEGWTEIAQKRVASAAYPGLAPILKELLAAHDGPVHAGAFGVAGPVHDDRSEATNLPWILDARALERAVPQLGRARLLNDFEAVALGLGVLRDDQLVVLQDRPALPGEPAAVLGAGTGLGEAILLPSGGALPRVFPTEGGHTDFPPRDALEIELLRFLQARHGRVSIERVVSGPGLAALYDFLVESGRGARVPEVESAPDRSAAIGRLGAEGTDPTCAEAVRRFVSLYGAEAGNLALKCLPRGGLYVAGGIAPKLLGPIRGGDFMKSFLNKGRMEKVLAELRVMVVTEPRVGLLGSRRAAEALCA